jgi:uncharacterized Fe-S cluster protein YjdI/CDGSH-type Zn-finger protein
VGEGGDESRCIHSERCVKALPAVFDRERKWWVEVDAASADELATAVEQCSTCALQYRRLDGREERPDPIPNVIARALGPLVMRRDLRIEVLDGTTVRTLRTMLCGCGVSANRPFCDGAHRDTALGASPI